MKKGKFASVYSAILLLVAGFPASVQMENGFKDDNNNHRRII